ncbi:helix-turn-helix transcriptional regulator [Nonomuraea sp. NPDC023979]|uniref:helix-turn-helix domain-containing protein n=1 Tax=Nonomuraea sp. NPDC023979 TaxID=3154796 RepID=UPI00341136A6
MILTITWEIPPGLTAERAAALAERWAAGELNSEDERLPRPKRIRATATDEPEIVSAARAQAIAEGRMLNQRRNQLGLSQRSLARLARVPRAAITDVENGRRGPGSATAIAMRRALDAVKAAR